MKLVEIVQYQPVRTIYMVFEKLCTLLPDALYLKMMYRLRLGKKLNLKNPQTYNEKLQWLKLYNQKPEYTTMVDKYAVKEYVAGKIGAEHVIPCIGVWNSFDEINFDELPDKFILKTTHGSGGFVICKDKQNFDKDTAKKTLTDSLKRNYFWGGREWPYKNVPRRIIAEPLIESLGKPESLEYKLTCFGGKVGFSTICKGIAHDKLNVRTNDFYDPDFKPLPFWSFYKHSENPITEKPACLDEMIRYAEILSEGIPEVRVDFYCIDDIVYFGEMTFFTWGGFNKFEPKEWDYKLGQMIELPKEKTIEKG